MNEPLPPPLPAAEWFYADAANQRIGPVSEESLLALHRQGVLRPESLVWRQGMDGWRALQQALNLPPPDLGAMQFRSGVPSGVTPQRRKGMSGCLIVALVLAAVSVPMLGILAAIALPAYQQYVVRSKVAMVDAAVNPMRKAVESSLASPDPACPKPGDIVPGQPIPVVADLVVGPQASGYCGIHVELGGTGSPHVDGHQIAWEYIDAGDTPAWQCTSDLDDKYLPSSCRTPATD